MPSKGTTDDSKTIEISEGISIDMLIDQLGIPNDTVKAVFLNGIRAKGDEILKDGDRVGIFPPVAGGKVHVDNWKKRE
jgi:molybdopterin synthase sulfur carrier subunit